MPVTSTSPIDALRTFEAGVLRIILLRRSIRKPWTKRNTPAIAPITAQMGREFPLFTEDSATLDAPGKTTTQAPSRKAILYF